MFITITFLQGNLEARILHNLPHIKKIHPVFKKNHISQIDYDNGFYYVKNNEGETVAQCHFEISDNQLSFTLFEGKEKENLFELMRFYLVEELCEKAFILTEENTMFYDCNNFFFKMDDKYYIIGNDFKRVILLEKHRIPPEIR